jgi:hypothetical protein
MHYFLWSNNRKESAFLLAVVCIAAVSKKRYRLEKDGDAFRKTFRDFQKNVTLSVEFRGKLESIENIFYKWVRCELIHEGEIPIDITFMEDVKPRSMSIRAGGSPSINLKIGTGWFFHIVNSLRESSESKNSPLV